MKKQILLLSVLGAGALVLTVFSAEARQGAEQGLRLSQNTIIPSLLPLLIIFMLIMKSGAKDIIARAFGFVSSAVFNLPYVSFPAILFGLVGGYPTGALLTYELYEADELSSEQAQRLMRFNFCGGCGFIITALGTARLKSRSAGLLLFASNVIASALIGFALSFKEKRSKERFFSFTPYNNCGDLINSAVTASVKSVLNITAVIVLFLSFTAIIPTGRYVMPLIEITSGLFLGESYPLALLSAYLSFGGLCIHLQLLGTIKAIGMKYADFFAFRIIGAVLSYGVTRLLLLLFPSVSPVFLNVSQPISLSSVNTALSILLVLGCFVLVLDLRSRKIKI